MKSLTKIGLLSLGFAITFGIGAYAAPPVPKIIVNGNEVPTDAQPKIIDGRVYVPIRAISEGFGTPISWDNDTKTVYVNSDPNTIPEELPQSWVLSKNLISKFIMAYDERDFERFRETITDDFETNIYPDDVDFPSIGGIESLGIIDYKIIASDGKQKFTVQIVTKNHPAIVENFGERNIKIENWEFELGTLIRSVKVVPNSTKYLDQYSVLPNITFGEAP